MLLPRPWCRSELHHHLRYINANAALFECFCLYLHCPCRRSESNPGVPSSPPSRQPFSLRRLLAETAPPEHMGKQGPGQRRVRSAAGRPLATHSSSCAHKLGFVPTAQAMNYSHSLPLRNISSSHWCWLYPEHACLLMNIASPMPAGTRSTGPGEKHSNLLAGAGPGRRNVQSARRTNESGVPVLPAIPEPHCICMVPAILIPHCSGMVPL